MLTAGLLQFIIILKKKVLKVKIFRVHGSENRFALVPPPLSTQLPVIESRFPDFLRQRIPVLRDIDGVLLVQPSTQSDCQGRMVIINSDGTHAKMCGNGLRTVARYLAHKASMLSFKVATDEAALAVQVHQDLAPGVPAIGVEISPVSFQPVALPMTNLGNDPVVNAVIPAFDPHLRFTAVAVPNPHLISFVPSVQAAQATLKRLGTTLNAPNRYFPDGVNISFAEIRGKRTLFVQTYERGVGFTNACGTGMAAASLSYVTAYHPELVEQPLTVLNPGGMVRTIVHRKKDGRKWIELIGNATITHEIEVTAAFAPLSVSQTNEEQAYQQWIRDQLLPK